ncbi:uncharacterized protein LOC114530505 [Dendronephthya gigantea]|uniref:uncharacterized protein LOC114530505 n=1 Tax=Dendronephthya gigantea TaxID=151771 RepID=UPI00106B92D9|nr:uncharacterized protein LOC114530505 [Dendronephthya gigantea]
MIDDPIITPGMEEFLLQTGSGLFAGSIAGGLAAPQGSLLLTSNNDVFNRADGRIIVLKYRKTPFSVEDRQKLKAGIGPIAEIHTGFLLAWVIRMFPFWQQQFPTISTLVEKILSRLVPPKIQDRWQQGASAIIATYAIFETSVGIKPRCKDAIMKLIQDMAVEKGNDGPDLLEKLNTCLMERLTRDDENVMKWLNPLTTVPVNQQYGPAIGIKSSVLDTFINLKSKDVSAFLKSMSDKTSSTSMMFAVQDDCTITDIKKRNEEKCKMAKGWKIPIAVIKPEALHIINGKYVIYAIMLFSAQIVNNRVFGMSFQGKLTKS